ncbi:hypothetical protein AWR27_07080 [Spirosoma montaniterrae]|uniref:HTH araC/xylS-type domain-containing protein n=1 Tax=Spirosoma montaniterrae TaxID=1178516 RepID=A0A1P9WUP7_9BACT|nr:hypothetical protein AWR27_07080 [Spirosoma montaniterrae]
MTPLADIPSFVLDEPYFYIHKTAVADTGFGSDNQAVLIDGGFGLYSCVNLRDEIGPLKSNVYRVALCLRGSVDVHIGLEKFTHEPNSIHFHTPNQLFWLRNKSADLDAYYLVFTSDFIDELLTDSQLAAAYPFFDYQQVPFFRLAQNEADAIKALLLDISDEVLNHWPDRSRRIKLLLNLIFITAKRSYSRQRISPGSASVSHSPLVTRYKKLVGQQYVTRRSVKEYADILAVSVSHLHKMVKDETGRSPGELIDDMLLMELRALLRYTDLRMSEIAYQLRFTDTSHLAKFFRKAMGASPSTYRRKHRLG